MKKLLLATAAGGLMMSTAFAQTPAPGSNAPAATPPAATTAPAAPSTTATTTAPGSAKFVAAQNADHWLASKFTGMDVVGTENEKIGDVNDILFDKDGNIFAAVLTGPRKGVFTVRRDDDFDITDGVFLPNGDLLLLERRFTMTTGVAMRLRRIEGETIRPGRVADGPVLLSADMTYQIDNMEGLDAWRRSDGALMVSVVSDDNHSMLQRNLYLEFRLHED